MLLHLNSDPKMGDYRALYVWQRAHAATLATYELTRDFPREEQFGLTSQMRRAAVSVAANLAEGCGRDSDREIARFTRIALGSASELEYYLMLAGDLNYAPAEQLVRLSEEVERLKPMLAKLAMNLNPLRR